MHRQRCSFYLYIHIYHIYMCVCFACATLSTTPICPTTLHTAQVCTQQVRVLSLLFCHVIFWAIYASICINKCDKTALGTAKFNFNCPKFKIQLCILSKLSSVLLLLLLLSLRLNDIRCVGAATSLDANALRAAVDQEEPVTRLMLLPVLSFQPIFR